MVLSADVIEPENIYRLGMEPLLRPGGALPAQALLLAVAPGGHDDLSIGEALVASISPI